MSGVDFTQLFKSKDAFTKALDFNGNGKLDATDILVFQQAMKKQNVESININGKDYGTLMGEAQGTKGGELIFLTEGQKANGNGGNDIEFNYEKSKIEEYKIKKGDTLYEIVQEKYGLTDHKKIMAKCEEIAAVNGLKDINTVIAGKKLQLVNTKDGTEKPVGEKPSESEGGKPTGAKPSVDKKKEEYKPERTVWEDGTVVEKYDEDGNGIYEKRVETSKSGDVATYFDEDQNGKREKLITQKADGSVKSLLDDNEDQIIDRTIITDNKGTVSTYFDKDNNGKLDGKIVSHKNGDVETYSGYLWGSTDGSESWASKTIKRTDGSIEEYKNTDKDAEFEEKVVKKRIDENGNAKDVTIYKDDVKTKRTTIDDITGTKHIYEAYDKNGSPLKETTIEDGRKTIIDGTGSRTKKTVIEDGKKTVSYWDPETRTYVKDRKATRQANR